MDERSGLLALRCGVCIGDELFDDDDGLRACPRDVSDELSSIFN